MDEDAGARTRILPSDGKRDTRSGVRLPEDEEAGSESAEGEVGEKVMGFLDHLEELRMTLFKCVVAFVIGAVLVAFFFSEFKAFLDWPMERGKLTSGHPEVMQTITNSMMGAFSVFISIGFLGAVFFSMPFMLIFLGQFIAPALTPKEKRLLTPAAIVALLLFVAGGAFAFFLLMPSVIEFSIKSNVILQTAYLLPLDSYYSTVTWMVLGLGAAFQFPMILQILIYLDLITVHTLRNWRRLAVVVCMVVAALITPTPDAIPMLMCAVPLYLLYEAAIIVARVYTAPLAARSRA